MNEVLGSPTKEDLSDWKNAKGVKFMAELPQKSKVSFEIILPECDVAEMELCSRMLVWDPMLRVTVEEALEHPFLRKLSDPDHEPTVIGMPDEAGNVSLEKLRDLIWQEILKYHPEFQE
jgi:mitogen-activated protein kinase 1/3